MLAANYDGADEGMMQRESIFLINLRARRGGKLKGLLCLDGNNICANDLSRLDT